ncbi:photosystem II assembly protein Psb34 [Calothrix rhizosoleniae]|uniref:photosystem II assembly protein Psb34 n=1 Tax=Calothrix rhizosoleniae TaxID=888997 RepID=UPI0011776FF7|nr:ssl1498 family light-harvesting-like protein [Calothrix rhizosoleniae]
MYNTVNGQGILNNNSNEPDIYYAEFPSSEQRNSYALQGGIAVLMVTALLLVACAVS